MRVGTKGNALWKWRGKSIVVWSHKWEIPEDNQDVKMWLLNKLKSEEMEEVGDDSGGGGRLHLETSRHKTIGGRINPSKRDVPDTAVVAASPSRKIKLHHLPDEDHVEGNRGAEPGMTPEEAKRRRADQEDDQDEEQQLMIKSQRSKSLPAAALPQIHLPNQSPSASNKIGTMQSPKESRTNPIVTGNKENPKGTPVPGPKGAGDGSGYPRVGVGAKKEQQHQVCLFTSHLVPENVNSPFVSLCHSSSLQAAYGFC